MKRSDKDEDPITLGYIVETNFFNFLLKVEEFFTFLGNPKWWIFDLTTFLMYLPASPYKIVRELHPEDCNFVYGEVPVMTMCRILRDVEACREDVFFDLGSGRGHGVFGAYFSKIHRCIGIELTGELVKRASRTAALMRAEGVEFRCGDFTSADLSEGTIFFLAGTTMEGEVIKKVASSILSIPHPVKVVSLSQRLPGDEFKTVFSRKYRFSWGEATVFFQTKD